MKTKMILLTAALVAVLAFCGLLVSKIASPADVDAVMNTVQTAAAPGLTRMTAQTAISNAPKTDTGDVSETEDKQADTAKKEDKQAESAKAEDNQAAAAETPKAEAKQVTAAASESSAGVKALGIVSGSEVRMRTSAGTDGTILTNLSSGTAVAIIGTSGDWYQVKYNGSTGYMFAAYVTYYSSISGLSVSGKVTADTLNVRSGAGSSNSVVTTVSGGTAVTVTGFENGWYSLSVNGTSGYASADYVSLVSSGSSTAAETPKTAATAAGSATGANIAATAQQYLGCSYAYGGAGPSSFDCSGFTMYIYGLYNISLPHGASDQMGYGTAVDKANLAPGDLVFFSYNGYAIGHVGIYIGNDSFVHASTYGVGVITSSLSSGSYPSRYVGARRIV